MNREVNNFMITMVVIVLALFIVIGNLIPILGVSLLAYAIGSVWIRFEWTKRYQISRQHLILSLIIGELLFFAIFGFLVFYVIEFFSPGLFWRLMFLGFAANLGFAYLFFVLGIKIAQKQLIKESS